MDDSARLEENRRRWDELVSFHVASRFYDVEGFVAGADPLLPIERAEVGDVEGKTLCHLQCHFGQDTLAWARRGAVVTGVDFSPNAIEAARALAARCGLQARFVESEVTAAAEALGGETFDVVYTSWGVLGWLPDLDAWARTVASLVAPGGFLYLAELHPTMLLFDGDAMERRYAYFRRAGVIEEEADGSYADPDARPESRREHCWIYELGHVVTALIREGLTLEFLHEHDGTCCQFLPHLERGEDGLWREPPGSLSLPLSFSLRARRERRRPHALGA